MPSRFTFGGPVYVSCAINKRGNRRKYNEYFIGSSPGVAYTIECHLAEIVANF